LEAIVPDYNTSRHISPARTACANCPFRTNPNFQDFKADQLRFIERFKIGELRLDSGTNILLEGARSPHLYTVLRGWAFRHKSLDDGRRQVLNFALPGDFIGLQMSVLGEMEHTVTSMTEATLCVFDRERLWEVFANYPDLSFSMTWMAAREEQLLDGNLVSLGQRSAKERIAYMVLQLYARAQQVGLAGNQSMETPFNQVHLADALGLTSVHVSRTLKQMEKEQLLAWSRPILRILDKEGLERAARETPPLQESRRFI
jgi:CRP/FNR family transcriptional regulator